MLLFQTIDEGVIVTLIVNVVIHVLRVVIVVQELVIEIRILEFPLELSIVLPHAQPGSVVFWLVIVRSVDLHLLGRSPPLLLGWLQSMLNSVVIRLR